MFNAGTIVMGVAGTAMRTTFVGRQELNSFY